MTNNLKVKEVVGKKTGKDRTADEVRAIEDEGQPIDTADLAHYTATKTSTSTSTATVTTNNHRNNIETARTTFYALQNFSHVIVKRYWC